MHSLFRPREIPSREIAEKRAAIGRVYTPEWAARMPWYQVLAVYSSMSKRGLFERIDSMNTKNTSAKAVFPSGKKARKAPKRHLIDDGIQISMFDIDYERQKSF